MSSPFVLFPLYFCKNAHSAKRVLTTHRKYDTVIDVVGGNRRRDADGGIAQLGERLNGIQEVSGSIPLISTMEKP